MQSTKTILWDWNGTLLNDTHICIDAMNILLGKRSKKLIDEKTYREIFTFPVRDYYIRAGFDFADEPFEKPALEFIEHYYQMVHAAPLFDDVKRTLEEVRNKGYTQMILSAMQQDFLDSQVAGHNISHYFKEISGLDNHYAAGKVDNARRLISGLDSRGIEIILVGDTLHDHEVSRELGIKVILVARGHQSAGRLNGTGCIVAGNLTEVLEYI